MDQRFDECFQTTIGGCLVLVISKSALFPDFLCPPIFLDMHTPYLLKSNVPLVPKFDPQGAKNVKSSSPV